jgi:glycosyltransferase involved in cell wall biosynthesis
MFDQLPTFPDIPRYTFSEEHLSTRLGYLLRPQSKIVWLYEQTDNSTFRYRVINTVDALRDGASDRVAATWFVREEIPLLLPYLPEIRTLVLCRVRYDEQVAHLLVAARSYGVELVFDCDDLVFNPEHVPLLIYSLDQNPDGDAFWDFWFGVSARMEAVARLCDRGICTNTFLAKEMQYLYEQPVGIVPNFLNREQQAISQRLFEAKSARQFVSEGAFVIGYFSGTPTHNKDWALVAPHIVRLLQANPNVRLWLAGHIDGKDLPRSVLRQVDVIPFQHFVDLQRYIAAADLNIAPLQINRFTHSKSPLKYFEAAAVGTYTLASPTFTFQEAMRDARHGRVVALEQWGEVLQETVDALRNAPQTEETARHDAAMVRERYGYDRQADHLLSVLLSGQIPQQSS